MDILSVMGKKCLLDLHILPHNSLKKQVESSYQDFLFGKSHSKLCSAIYTTNKDSNSLISRASLFIERDSS